MRKINIITKDNGVGLSQDMRIIMDVLKNDSCMFLDVYGYNLRNADINIFLELLDPRFFKLAPKNILIPNPEWFFTQWKRFVPHFDLICCKTIDTYTIFKKLSSRCHYTSFTSFDKRDKTVVRENQFLHLAGKSSHKNTDAVIKCWNQNNTLPKLSLIKQENNSFETSDNITLHKEALTDETLNFILNKCRFHLCPSEYEGFGHYINEARSVGAVIISTDAAPMNEMVKDNFGVLIKPEDKSTMFNLGRCHKIDPGKLLLSVNKLLSLTEKELTTMSEMTRCEYLDNDLFFRYEFKKVIDSL